MKTGSGILIGMTIALGVATCLADGVKKAPSSTQAKHAKWLTEPNQFMGINVDGSESNLCHGSSPCAVMGELTNLPDLGFSVDGSAFEFEDRVAYVALHFDHDDAARMAALLIEKFGAPTAKRTASMTSVMGVKVWDTQYEWSGSKVDILFKEHDDNLGKGLVMVTCVPVWGAYQADYVKRNGNPVDHL